MSARIQMGYTLSNSREFGKKKTLLHQTSTSVTWKVWPARLAHGDLRDVKWKAGKDVFQNIKMRYSLF